jgi:hypothetical protein
MSYRILHMITPMLEDFRFESLEDALNDLIGAWEDDDLDLTGLISFLHEQGVRVQGLATDDDVTEAMPPYILESIGIMARGLIADNLTMQQGMADAIALGAGILILSDADPWFQPLSNFCERRGGLDTLPATHTNPAIEAAVNTWLRRA